MRWGCAGSHRRWELVVVHYLWHCNCRRTRQIMVSEKNGTYSPSTLFTGMSLNECGVDSVGQQKTRQDPW